MSTLAPMGGEIPHSFLDHIWTESIIRIRPPISLIPYKQQEKKMKIIFFYTNGKEFHANNVISVQIPKPGDSSEVILYTTRENKPVQVKSDYRIPLDDVAGVAWFKGDDCKHCEIFEYHTKFKVNCYPQGFGHG